MAKANIAVLDWKQPVTEAIVLSLIFVAGCALYTRGGALGKWLKPIVPVLEAMG
jgi:hypothetical protein